jgi:hypothetical protein
MHPRPCGCARHSSALGCMQPSHLLPPSPIHALPVIIHMKRQLTLDSILGLANPAAPRLSESTSTNSCHTKEKKKEIKINHTQGGVGHGHKPARHANSYITHSIDSNGGAANYQSGVFRHLPVKAVATKHCKECVPWHPPTAQHTLKPDLVGQLAEHEIKNSFSGLSPMTQGGPPQHPGKANF